jgi:hypothetical protein
MFRIDNSTSVPARPLTPGPGTGGYFTNGDPNTALQPTVVDDWWMNQVQEEILTVIVNAGFTPNKLDTTQLWQAIHAIATGIVGPPVGGPWLPLTGGTLYSAGANDPLEIYADNGHLARIRYAVSGARLWTAGCDDLGRFAIADETAVARRLEIDTTGNVNISAGLVTNTLNVATNAVIGGSANIGGSATVGWAFNVGGPAGFANDLTVAGNIGANSITLGGTLSLGLSAGVAGNLTVDGNIGANHITAGGNLGVGLVLTVAGNANIAGNCSANAFVTTSDARLKENVTILDPNTLVTGINALRPVQFNYEADLTKKRYFGLIAQEVESTPLATSVQVMTDEAGKTEKTPDGKRGIDYDQIVVALVGAVQNLSQRVTKLGG